MQAMQIAASVGGFCGALVGFTLAGLLSASPLARDFPTATERVSELVVVLLLLAGAVVGLRVLDRSARLPADGPEADFDDNPPAR